MGRRRTTTTRTSGARLVSEWYADGLRFECTSCGNCCSGPPGAVWMSDDESRALAERFGLPLAVFLEKYARKLGTRWSLNEVSVGMSGGRRGFDCVFLDRTKVPGKALCSVYESRPTQCRTWPFWSENLDSEQIWENVKRVTPCPGMGAGQLHTFVEICIKRDTDRHAGATPPLHPPEPDER